MGVDYNEEMVEERRGENTRELYRGSAPLSGKGKISNVQVQEPHRSTGAVIPMQMNTHAE